MNQTRSLTASRGAGATPAPRGVWVVLALGATVFAVLAAAASASAAVRIETLSNRADLISGGEALTRIVLPAGTQASEVSVTADGRDVSSDFAVRPGGSYEGLLTGLSPGANVVRAVLPDGSGAQLTITNHPIGGPVFSGPQIQPWICGTEVSGLGPPTDAQCDAPPSYEYKYKSTATGKFEAYNRSEPPPPAAIATTTTDQGVTVPYVVRVERGAEDRGLYEIAVLADPSGTWQPWASQAGWNHKLLVPFGGNVGPGHVQAVGLSPLVDYALSRGFMVADSGLNAEGEDANTVVSAEALMMLKEHIADSYGAIRYTIGEGCSGGSLQQQMIAATYPGLLNGIQPNCSFPDLWTTAPELVDCHLLIKYFEKYPSEPWIPQIDGHHDPSDCEVADVGLWHNAEPGNASNCGIPESEVYNPDTNPEGTRCSLPDYQINIWGPRPKSEWEAVEQRIHKGFANRPFDSVGVQYGLKALQAGLITAAEFANLNARIGCGDIDAHPGPGRCAMNTKTATIAYRTGEVTDARQLASVPIIDLRGWSEDGDVHTSVFTYIMRARFDAENGNHANQIIWTFKAAYPIQGMEVGIAAPELGERSFLLMDHWLAAIEADRRKVALAQKVREDKPAEGVDACFPDNRASSETTDMSACEALFPHYDNTRTAAGEPLTGQYLKCQLKPLARSDYNAVFTEEQWSELEQAFPTGVCDFSKPAVGERASIPWMSFARGPGGRPLGRPPRSTRIIGG
jgi:Tannase-like family of unknown function (DUF6351)